jgi:hypothetical protein
MCLISITWGSCFRSNGNFRRPNRWGFGTVSAQVGIQRVGFLARIRRNAPGCLIAKTISSVAFKSKPKVGRLPARHRNVLFYYTVDHVSRRLVRRAAKYGVNLKASGIAMGSAATISPPDTVTHDDRTIRGARYRRLVVLALEVVACF